MTTEPVEVDVTQVSVDLPFRTAYDGKPGPAGLSFVDAEDLTEQSHKDQCDVNRILERFQKTQLDVFAHRLGAGEYMDVSNVPDYQTALMQVRAAEEMFMEVPAEIRAEFDNDPGRFLSFVQDPGNVERMREMGLMPPEAPGKAEEAEVAPPPAEPPPAPNPPPAAT